MAKASKNGKGNVINREELLRRLQSVEPGLAPREIIDQTTCLIFQDGQVFTYNDEVACRGPGLPDASITGAVQAKQLISYLQKMTEEDVELYVEGNDLVVKGKGKGAKVRMAAEILLPLATIEQPDEAAWVALPKRFLEALALVQECACKDMSRPEITHINIHPDWLEACDGYQLARYRVSTQLPERVNVRKTSVQHAVRLGADQWAQTPSWLHFRNPAGVVLSCRRYLEEFPDLDSFLGVTGSPVTLPASLAESMGRAEVFSSDVGSQEDNQVLVELSPERVRVRAQGTNGECWEGKTAGYAGEPLAFLVTPKTLAEIVKKNTKAEVTNDRIIVTQWQEKEGKDGKVKKRWLWKYVCCLTTVEEAEERQAATASVEADGSNNDEGDYDQDGDE